MASELKGSVKKFSMTKVQKHCSSALSLLVILYISTAASFAQRSAIRDPSWRTDRTGDLTQIPIDPFAVLPASDALVLLDLKRVRSDVVPRLLVDEQDARALVMAVNDPKMIQLLDPGVIQRLVAAFRYSNPQDKKSDFDVVTVAQSSEAGQLSTLIRSRGSGKYREQQYAGKLLYITQLEQSEPKGEATTVTSSDETEWAIVALDANTLVFGTPAYVRSSIDVNTGKGTTVSAELVAAVKRNSKALLSAAGRLPPSLMFAGQQLGNSDLSQMLSSLKQFYASVELVPTGLEVAVTLNTTSPEQAKSLVDLLGAFKTVAVSFGPGKTKQHKLARELIKGVVISAGGTEVQIRDEITQASVNELAKQYASGMYFSQGLAQVQKGDSEAAIVEYDKAIMLDPENANTFVNRGKARANKGALDAAIADYDKAISLDPDNALAYNNRCFVRDKKGDFDAAIVDCDKTIALDASFAFAYNNRGLAFASQGKLDKAIPDYDKSIALDGENIFAYQNRGDARIKIGNWDGAIADFQKCITINDKSVEAYNGRGLARYYKGELDQAIADFDRAIAINPMAPIYVNRGYARNQKSDYQGAIADFDKAISLNPKLADAYNARGLAHYYKTHLDQAIADYDEAIAIDPNLAEAYGNRALCLLELRRDAQAEEDLKKCFELNESLRRVFDPLVKEIKKTRHTKRN